MVSDGVAVFAALLESVFLVEANGTFVFAEDADVEFGRVESRKPVKSPGHEFVAEALAEKLAKDVKLPEFHRTGSGLVDRDMNGADFCEGDELLLIFDDLVGEPGVGKFLRDNLIVVGLFEEEVEVFGGVEVAEGFDEGVPAEGGEFREVFGSGRAQSQEPGIEHGNGGLLLKLFELDVAEPDGLAFSLKGDVAVGELEGLAGFEEGFGGDDGAFGVELGFLIAQDFPAVDPVDDLFVPPDFDFNFDPLVGRDGGGGGLDDVLGDELAVHLEVGARGADVAGGAFSFSFIGEELEFEADGEALIEGHALGRLGVDHDAAVEIHVAGGVGHHFPGEFILHAEKVVGVGEVGVEVAEFFVEPGVFVVFAFEDAVFDAEGVEGVFAEGVLGNFGSPAGEVLAIEKGDPFGGVGGEEESDTGKELADHGREDGILS